MLQRLLVAAVLGALAVGCSPAENNTTSQIKDSGVFNPVPENPESIAAQLQRYPGQTRFLNPSPWYRYAPGYDRGLADDAEAAGAREVQESDIFKVGKEGSKLLYLLNNYRGLQVVSFEQSVNEPQLLSRLEATGNWPQDMYFDAERDRILVLERLWYDDSGDAVSYSDAQSRLLIYDVADPTDLKQVQEIEIKGEIADSRMVGDVLYVATRLRPSTRSVATSGKGFVFSYRLGGEAVELVDSQELSGSVSFRENMNIIQVEGEATSYYLVAVLAGEGGSWSSSRVEVVDISSNAGAIVPKMVVSAKGLVAERSQTMVKDSALLVTSNYLPEENGEWRIAVETFLLPTGDSVILTKDEAEFRKAYIEREVGKERRRLMAEGLSGDRLEEALEDHRQVLLADEELGLKGRFIREGDSLRKAVPDHRVTIGSTQGLSASLQDVRYEGDLLYVYWVPQNNIDPLDLFDTSNLERDGARHLQHLEFDGWIQRAIPMNHDGRSFVLGLGWIVPSLDNESGRRYPQAVLFEIENQEGQINAVIRSSLTLENSELWTNFNGQDRDVTVRREADGTGYVLFRFSSFAAREYTSGGKLIGFDLNQPSAAFQDGAILEADAGWLRRVFENPEIDRINTFSDQALGTYALDGEVGNADVIVQAVHVLELARNIVSYEVIGGNDSARGLQIVSDPSYWSRGDAETELRLTDPTDADAELSEVIQTLKTPGSHVDHLIDESGKALWLLTRDTDLVVDEDSEWGYRYETTTYVARFSFTQNLLRATGMVSWLESGETTGPRLRLGDNLVQLSDGRILAAGSNQLKVILSDAEIELQDLSVSGCGLEVGEYATLRQLSGSLFATFSQTVSDPSRENLNYYRNFFAPAGVTRESPFSLTCSSPVNIPGELLRVQRGHAVTSDLRLIDIVPGEEDSFQVLTDEVMASVAIDDGLATLRDLYDLKEVDRHGIHHLSDGTMVFIERENERSDIWWAFDDIRWPNPYSSGEARFVIVGFAADLGFTKTVFGLETGLGSNERILEVFENYGDQGDALALLGSGRKLQALRFAESQRPAIVPLKKERDGEASEVAVLVSPLWYWSNAGQKLNYNRTNQSLEVSLGLHGVTQLYLTE